MAYVRLRERPWDVRLTGPLHREQPLPEENAARRGTLALLHFCQDAQQALIPQKSHTCFALG